MKPDIQNPISLWVVGGLAVVAISTLAGGVYLFKSNKVASMKEEVTKFKGFVLPEDYFTMSSKTIQRDTIKTKAVEEPVKLKKDKKYKGKKASSRKYKAPPKNNVVTPKIVYLSAPKPQIDLKTLNLRNRINAARQASALSMTARNEASGKNKWVNSQEDYEDEGLIRKEASYPVDLSRTITTDRNISAILIEDIVSEFNGKITALIDHNIYGAHGRNILIPAGSKAVGEYAASSALGQRKLNAIWNRILTPKGININIQAPIADMMGRSGIGGEVDNRWIERFGAAVFISTISAAGQVSVPVKSPQEQAGVNALTTQFSQIASVAIQQNMSLKPLIYVPAGTLIQISIREDIWFKKAEKANSYSIEKVK